MYDEAIINTRGNYTGRGIGFFGTGTVPVPYVPVLEPCQPNTK